MPLTLALRLQPRVVEVPGGGASLRVRPPTVSEALLLLAAAERSVSPALADELRVSAAADLEDLAEAWLPEPLARAVLAAPAHEKASLLLPLLEDPDDPYAEPEAAGGEKERPEERMQSLLALDWDRLVVDVAALHHASPLDVLAWPWGVFLYLVADLPRHEARLQYRHAVAAIAGQSAEVLDQITTLAHGHAAAGDEADVVVVTTTDPEVLATNRARLREALGASAAPPPYPDAPF